MMLLTLQVSKLKTNKTLNTYTMSVDSVTEFVVDMSCGNCQKKVNAALVDVPGVKQVDIDLATKRVYDDVPRPRKPV
jgi:hypothetical protein